MSTATLSGMHERVRPIDAPTDGKLAPANNSRIVQQTTAQVKSMVTDAVDIEAVRLVRESQGEYGQH